MELIVTTFLHLVHALFFFIFSSVSGIFRVLGTMFGLAIWIGVLLRELNIRVFERHCPIVHLVT